MHSAGRGADRSPSVPGPDPRSASPATPRGVTFEIHRREALRHNPLNEVTRVVERVADRTGRTVIRKELGPPRDGAAAPEWAASRVPWHWNYWRREAEVYRSGDLRASLAPAGLDLPAAEVEEHADGVTLWLEDVVGTPGADFDLGDHAALAAAVGRWQAQGPMAERWASHRFLRHYSTSRPAPLELVDDDDAWRQPLIRETWPADLRSGWRRLLNAVRDLLATMEALPRTRSHLDLWVSNEIRRPGGEVVLLDWSFAGDGAIGEDVGNHVPDAVFDLFWPADRLDELDAACFGAYLSGLRDGGWRGDERLVRLGMVASCVKYAWLLPLLLGRASEPEHAAYHRTADARVLYEQRGAALRHLVAWCDEAVRLRG